LDRGEVYVPSASGANGLSVRGIFARTSSRKFELSNAQHVGADWPLMANDSVARLGDDEFAAQLPREYAPLLAGRAVLEPVEKMLARIAGVNGTSVEEAR